MNENEIKYTFDKYYDKIKNVKRLNIKEAKELYNKALNAKNERDKNLYIDKIICGTLYLVLDHIKRHQDNIYMSNMCDLDDIISSYTENLVKNIKAGKLLNCNALSVLVSRNPKVVTDQNYGYYEPIPNRKRLSELFCDYVDYRNGKISYLNFNEINEGNVLVIFEKAYDEYVKNGDKNITAKEFYNACPFFIKNAQNTTKINGEMTQYKKLTENMEECAMDKVLVDKILEEMPEYLSKKEMHMFIKMRCEGAYAREAAEKYQLTSTRASQIADEAVDKIAYHCRKFKI